ncbi:hypothetical protein D5F01_LYC09787 [Larimichthys crocea]|uniref:Uncharacterized protein n=1 Tax=Larimichthys crocea TaxID=215358 RepID=A0A6G0ILK3_LARCR|nr:hypothetical protein D5F01_LYC09787 [Larimichthys crocea]
MEKTAGEESPDFSPLRGRQRECDIVTINRMAEMEFRRLLNLVNMQQFMINCLIDELDSLRSLLEIYLADTNDADTNDAATTDTATTDSDTSDAATTDSDTSDAETSDTDSSSQPTQCEQQENVVADQQDAEEEKGAAAPPESEEQQHVKGEGRVKKMRSYLSDLFNPHAFNKWEKLENDDVD